MSFHNILFPMRIARGATGGPVRRTNIATRNNGKEIRIASNANSLRQWQISSRNCDLNDIAEVVAFFEARLGRLYSFRFKDPFDNKSCSPIGSISALDQIIGTGDGVTTSFQLVKNYGDAIANYARTITKPVQDSVIIAIGGNIIGTGNYETDYQSGIITFANAPTNGAVISAGFEFDCVARFENEQLELSLDGQINGHISDIIITEVLS